MDEQAENEPEAEGDNKCQSHPVKELCIDLGVHSGGGYGLHTNFSGVSICLAWEWPANGRPIPWVNYPCSSLVNWIDIVCEIWWALQDRLYIIVGLDLVDVRFEAWVYIPRIEGKVCIGILDAAWLDHFTRIEYLSFECTLVVRVDARLNLDAKWGQRQIISLLRVGNGSRVVECHGWVTGVQVRQV